jgi:hypothetical protein
MMVLFVFSVVVGEKMIVKMKQEKLISSACRRNQKSGVRDRPDLG